ncbi:nlpa lipoprotein [Lucifera butyrica]|uniref:Lipoprotein n=1 Tax=Lucifera butyrica TaxID=1351585 RepID=A0A498R9P7_9FIRM|nr:MetQ/NlpA family ABC transporter substrate-binding protein [Lucifera butyrica]VBB06992.1 nlpa lipoprotein [Lucifera butyrica]
MKLRSLIGTAVIISSIAVLLAGCGRQAGDKVLKVGVTAGPHTEIMEAVQKVAAKDGLKLEIVEFNDYIQPNVALSQGDIDMNSFQHQPYLDNVIKDRKYDLVTVAKTVIFPMGLYSQKIKNIADLRPGAIVAIPNDPTNGGRALLLLAKAGLIQLKPGTGLKAAVSDIVENPKNITVKELDAAQIPRSLPDVDLAAINTNYAMTAGLVPTKDAIAMEAADSPYANILVCRSRDRDDRNIQKLIKAYHSPAVKQFIEEHFKGSVVPAW